MEVKEIVWLIGAGPMAVDYAKVLKELGIEFITITRGKKKAKEFSELTATEVVPGGVEEYLKNCNYIPRYVINSVGIDKLSETTQILLNAGIKNILLEKPGVAYADEIYGIDKLVTEKKSNVILAYNRRFYQSVIAAKKIIEEDGEVTSFNFEFTEWSHSIAQILHLKTKPEMENWFLGNSTHVIDMAFYLGGMPNQISSFYSGKNELDWHKSSSNYSGAGITKKGALFAYHANWKSPGRFSIEVLTNKHRLIFRPLEKLQIQNIGSVAISMVENIDYSLDEKFKPGLYLQTKTFLENNYSDFCSIHEQAEKMPMYKQMSGY